MSCRYSVYQGTVVFTSPGPAGPASFRHAPGQARKIALKPGRSGPLGFSVDGEIVTITTAFNTQIPGTG